MNPRDVAVQAIGLVARALGNLCDQVVFVGGAVAALYSSDGVAVDVRITKDVDCIIEVGTVGGYHDLTMALRCRDFKEDNTPGAPRCRFRLDLLVVDVMPTDESVLGFSNRWFPEALRTAEQQTLEDDLRIRVVRPLYFVATKLVAFADRGEGDYFASHDLEDIVSVLDALAPLRGDILSGTEPVHTFIREELRAHHKKDAFRDSILGHLSGDDRRSNRLLDWMDSVSAYGQTDRQD